MASDPSALMASYAEDAVRHAQKTCSVVLDFSPQSVELLESNFERLIEPQPKGVLGRLLGLGAPDRAMLARMYGAYVGEVIRRVHGWEWAYERDLVPGAAVVCLRRGERTLFPLTQVEDRLRKGVEASLWLYYKAVAR